MSDVTYKREVRAEGLDMPDDMSEEAVLAWRILSRGSSEHCTKLVAHISTLEQLLIDGDFNTSELLQVYANVLVGTVGVSATTHETARKVLRGICEILPHMLEQHIRRQEEEAAELAGRH